MINFFKKYQLIIGAVLAGLLIFTWQSCKTRAAEKEAAKYKAQVNVMVPELDKLRKSNEAWAIKDKANAEAMAQVNTESAQHEQDAINYKNEADKKQKEINKIKDCPSRADALDKELTKCNKKVEDVNKQCVDDKKAINKTCDKSLKTKDGQIAEKIDLIENPETGYIKKLTDCTASVYYWQHKNKKHWVFGPQGGFGYIPSISKTTAYVGVGVTYKIWEW